MATVEIEGTPGACNAKMLTLGIFIALFLVFFDDIEQVNASWEVCFFD